MIAVFIPALILEIFTAYCAIKVLIFNSPVKTYVFTNIAAWNVFFVLPTIVVIYFCESTVGEGRNLKKCVEKYLNYCGDDITFLRVKICILSKLIQKVYFLNR